MKKILTSSLILASLGLLVSCGPGQARSERKQEAVELSFPQEYKSDKPGVSGVTYTIGLVTSSPFKGIFVPTFTSDSTDSTLVSYTNEQIFDINDDFESFGVNSGMGSFDIDAENNMIIVKLREGLKWSDGEPMTVDDIIYTYEVLAHKDYSGTTYNEVEHGKIAGLLDYHNGKAKTISGLEKISDTELHIHVSSVSPKLITGGGPLLGISRVLPKHYLQDVAVKDLPQSEKGRKKPVGNGKYVLKNIVPGESVEYVPNEHYYLGKAKVDRIIIKTLTPQLALESLRNGEYFDYIGLPTNIYSKYKDFSNVSLIGSVELAYNYLGFNLGHYDNEQKLNIMDRDTPLQDVRIRKAIAYAVNTDEIAQAFFEGLRFRANGVTPPIFKKFYDPTLEGYPYNLDKAKELLKEAGYVDSDNDGYVDKDGKNLELKFASIAGSDIAEPLAQAMIQYWKNIGIKVELTTGRLLDINLFYDKVQANDNDIDIFMGGWGVGTSLDPAQTTSKTAQFTFSRFRDDENDRLLEAINDPKGLTDPAFRAERYKEWQKHYIQDLAVEIPLLFRYSVQPVNKAIKYANTFHDSARAKYFIETVETTPLKAN